MLAHSLDFDVARERFIGAGDEAVLKVSEAKRLDARNAAGFFSAAALYARSKSKVALIVERAKKQAAFMWPSKRVYASNDQSTPLIISIFRFGY